MTKWVCNKCKRKACKYNDRLDLDINNEITPSKCPHTTGYGESSNADWRKKE